MAILQQKFPTVEIQWEKIECETLGGTTIVLDPYKILVNNLH